jgi:hypothetical protein
VKRKWIAENEAIDENAGPTDAIQGSIELVHGAKRQRRGRGPVPVLRAYSRGYPGTEPPVTMGLN